MRDKAEGKEYFEDLNSDMIKKQKLDALERKKC